VAAEQEGWRASSPHRRRVLRLGRLRDPRFVDRAAAEFPLGRDVSHRERDQAADSNRLLRPGRRRCGRPPLDRRVVGVATPGRSGILQHLTDRLRTSYPNLARLMMLSNLPRSQVAR